MRSNLRRKPTFTIPIPEHQKMLVRAFDPAAIDVSGNTLNTQWLVDVGQLVPKGHPILTIKAGEQHSSDLTLYCPMHGEIAEVNYACDFTDEDDWLLKITTTDVSRSDMGTYIAYMSKDITSRIASYRVKWLTRRLQTKAVLLASALLSLAAYYINTFLDMR